MIDFFNQIGFLGILLICIGILVIIIAWNKVKQINKQTDSEKVSITIVWLSGVIAFLFGLFIQTLRMISVFDQIRAAGDVSASIISGELKDSSITTSIGFVILLLSLVIWGILKEIKSRKIAL